MSDVLSRKKIWQGPGKSYGAFFLVQVQYLLQGRGGIVPWPKMRVPFLEQGGKIISPFGWAQGCLVRALKDLDHQMVGQMVVGYLILALWLICSLSWAQAYRASGGSCHPSHLLVSQSKCLRADAVAAKL